MPSYMLQGKNNAKSWDARIYNPAPGRSEKLQQLWKTLNVKVVADYFTSGEMDFLLIVEMDNNIDAHALGRAMVENTEGQAGLHGQLISTTAKELIDIARKHGALGWKVNGAGGEGGSLTVLSDHDSKRKRKMTAAMEEFGRGVVVIPIYLSRTGLRVWESAEPRSGSLFRSEEETAY